MPVEKGSKKTDAKRKAENKWNREHTKTAACKLSIEKYNQFQAIAQKHGKTVSGLLLEYVNQCICQDQPE